MNANHPLRTAKWIWPEGCHYQQNTYAQFRRDFTLRRRPTRAPLFITADQSYMLYVNGQYVGRGPARGFQATWAYDEFDLAPHLARGHNWISVRAFNGGISTFGYLFEWTAGLLVAARWPGFELYSDADWPSRVSAAYRRDTKRVSTQLNLQEQVDARLDDQEWLRSPRPPRDWSARSQARPCGIMPWHALEPRGLANLGQRLLPYERTCTSAAGRCSAGYDDTVDVADAMRRELPRLRWQPAAAGRRTKAGLAVTVPPAGRGRLATVTVDLGQLGVGTLLVEARGAAGGESVDFNFGEIILENGSPLLASSMAARLRLAPGRTRHELYQMMGHRYLTVVVRDSRRPITLHLALRETVYPFDLQGKFDCDDALLNDIHRIAVRTQQVCSLDSYVDTPWREQAQWWGDARVQARNTFHLTTDARLLARGVRCLARQEVPNGLTYGHAPTNCHGCVLPDFSLIWALTIWDYYWQTGDLGLFTEHWQRIERLLGYFTGEGRGRDGLLRYDERYWLFLDWCQIFKKGAPTLLNLWYLLTLEKLATMAGLAGLAAEQRRLQRLHGEQKRLILAKLWDDRAGLFRDGLTFEGRPVEEWSIHNQALAIMCGLRKSDWPGMIERRLLPYLRSDTVPGALPSSYWVTYVYGVMTDLGHGAEVVRHLREKFGPMVPYGGTWEVFDFKPGQGSVSHAWSAHPIYHLAGTLGGVRQTAAAWGEIVFAPDLGLAEVGRAGVVVPTPQGRIRADWRRREKIVDVRLALPPGVTAEARLPGRRAERVTGRQQWQLPWPPRR